MKQAFIDGGWGMFPVLVFGLVLIAVAIVHALSSSGRGRGTVFSMAFVTFAAGTLGLMSGIIHTVKAGQGLATDALAPLLVEGFGESLNDLAFATALLVLAGLITAGGELRRWLRPEPTPASDSASTTSRARGEAPKLRALAS